MTYDLDLHDPQAADIRTLLQEHHGSRINIKDQPPARKVEVARWYVAAQLDDGRMLVVMDAAGYRRTDPAVQRLRDLTRAHDGKFVVVMLHADGTIWARDLPVMAEAFMRMRIGS